jgi:hypothetical protein
MLLQPLHHALLGVLRNLAGTLVVCQQHCLDVCLLLL